MVNCLPGRVRVLLQVVDDRDFVTLGALIAENEVCPRRAGCLVAQACARIHAAFLPLSAVEGHRGD